MKLSIKMSKWVIGISGVTCGGKTTVARIIKSKLEKKNSVFLYSQDDYYKDEKEINIDNNGFVKWDCVQAVDFKALIKDVNCALKKYEIIIVEGTLIFMNKDLNQLFMKRFFLNLDFEEAQKRRKERIYDPPDVDGLFEKHVWPEYVKCNEHVKKEVKCTFIDASLDKKEVVSSIVNSLAFIEQ